MSVEPSLVLVLRLEDRFLHADDDGGVDRLADVGGVEVLLEMVAQGLDEALAEGGEVGAAHGGVLAVDEGQYSSP